MKRILIYLCSVIICLSACRHDKGQNATEDLSEMFSSELPEDFLSFYMRFHTDSLYQIEHVIFPLQMKADSSYFYPEDWRMHRPFADQGGEYQQGFININGLIIEKIVSANQVFRMERRFSKSGGAYNLIYYHVDNAFSNNSDWEAEEPSS